MDAAFVKRRARELGADLVGVASAAVLNAHPPDPECPQTPERITSDCKSVIVIACRIPVAAFRAKTNAVTQYLDMLVLRRMDRIAFILADELERQGHSAFILAAQETDWSYKKASYGVLSTRHLGIEAGLGTLGLDVNILTPEFGPRLYLTGILTGLELEADSPMTEQVCIGEGCSRCIYSCPADAVRHWDIDKRLCATEAQEFGFMTATALFREFVDAPPEEKRQTLRSRELFGFWQGLTRVVGSFGDCPRCLAVCPVGDDYHAHLDGPQKRIPEKTEGKAERGKTYRLVRKAGTEIPGLSSWNVRWVGPEGYRGLVAEQMRSFRSRAAAYESSKSGAGAGEERE